MSLDLSHHITGHLAQPSGAAVAAIKLRAAAWEVAVDEAPGRLSLMIWGCRLDLAEAAGGDGLRLSLSGPERRLVETLQDLTTEIMDEAGITVVWNRVNTGALAPGLVLARVAAIGRPSPGFLRVRVEAAGLARFAVDTSLHFRLLIPPAGRPPVWPRVAQTGRTVWPEGDEALHRAVFTVAAHGPDWIAFEVFLHPGSPTCDWLAGRPLGATAGILGPGGGGCPDAQRILFYGDETALPPIRRMLALAPGAARAMIRAAAADMGDLGADPRVRRCDDLLAALLTDAPMPASDTHVWFAGRADQARAARAHLLAAGWDKKQITCAAYWDQDASAA